ncbi:glycosyltransferase family 2 protein [Haliscomenobacter sp.]|uniref:glycosyltransferase family 2 protein n=1 Tax=Haliscomenobacter sp. TaxID=2717303 RepID=UPI0035944D24
MKVSIITPTFNSVETLQDTIHSIGMQTYADLEYIIIDGGSKDGTIDIIKRNIDLVTCWVSEPDHGIYDAMNKGISMATGEIIAILNSDDYYVNEHVISQVVDNFKRHEVDSIYGNLQYVGRENTSRVIRHWVSGHYQLRKFLFGWMPPHPAFFVKRKLYLFLGQFNTQLKTSADYELMLRFLYKHKVSSHYLPELLVRMRVGGASNQSWKKRVVANLEDRRAWKMNGLQPYFFTAVLKPLRKINQFFISRSAEPYHLHGQKESKQHLV